MSVRKLALALKSRVNELRESLVAKPRRKFHIAAIVAGLACSVQAITPNDCFAQETLPVQDPHALVELTREEHDLVHGKELVLAEPALGFFRI